MKINIQDYKILNADARENDTDSDRYLIKIESEESDFNLPEQIELSCNNILLDGNLNEV